MSWSVQAVGKAAAVARAIAEQMAKIPKMESPEQDAKDRAALTIAETMAVMPDNVLVEVSANGSQWSPKEGVKFHTHKLEIKAIGGFVE